MDLGARYGSPWEGEIDFAGGLGVDGDGRRDHGPGGRKKRMWGEMVELEGI